MQNRKLFSQMSPEEQGCYCNELQTFFDSKFNILTSEAKTAEDATVRKEAALEGFSLVTAFSFCRDFVSERMMFGDFSTSVCLRLSQYFEEIKKQTSSITQHPSPITQHPSPITQHPSSIIQHPSPITQHPIPSIPTRHRGRPTKAEAQKYENAQRAKEAKELKQHPSMFPQPVDDSTNTQHPSPTTFDFTMREYRWLLSEALQHDIDGLRDYRTAFSDASQKAKFLAEQSSSGGVSTPSTKAEIADLAQEAHEINAIIEGIYQAVDRELAEACLRLKYDPHYTKRMADRGVNTEELRQALVPKLKVVIASNPTFKQSVLDKIHDEDPALAAQRKALATAKSEVDAIRKYMLRTDKPATAKRIATMEKRLARLRELDKEHPELKIEPDSYLAVINKTKSDLGQYTKHEGRYNKQE